jgi:hypothetical protein
MKDYGIWLKSGQCVEGTVEDEVAEKIIKDYSHKPHDKSIRQFHDTDGLLILSFSNVIAIAINKCEECSKVEGFKA